MNRGAGDKGQTETALLIGRKVEDSPVAKTERTKPASARKTPPVATEVQTQRKRSPSAQPELKEASVSQTPLADTASAVVAFVTAPVVAVVEATTEAASNLTKNAASAVDLGAAMSGMGSPPDQGAAAEDEKGEKGDEEAR
jgi:hypothetical protein